MAQITPTYKELKRDLIRIQLDNGNPNEIADAIIARFWKNTNAIKNEQQNKPPLTYQIGKEPLLIVANKQLKKEQKAILTWFGLNMAVILTFVLVNFS